MIRYLSILTFATLLSATACNIPVFRYALERWPADRFDLRLHAPEDAKIADVNTLMEKAKAGHEANLRVSLRVGQEPAWQLYPPFEGGIIWSGPLTDQSLDLIMHSPARQDIAKRLLSGESVVWVFLESGDADADQAAYDTLNGHLEWVVANRQLPTLAEDDVIGEEVPLKLAMSTIRVDRTTPEEVVFIKLLEHVEDDLADCADQPIAIPIFGRGRALYGLVGQGITRDNVDEASKYLIGACSCLVKEENPGVDLLMTADWEAPFIGAPITPVEPPELVGMAFAPPMTATQPIAQVKIGNITIERAGGVPLSRVLLLLLGLAVLMVAAGTIATLSRAKR